MTRLLCDLMDHIVLWHQDSPVAQLERLVRSFVPLLDRVPQATITPSSSSSIQAGLKVLPDSPAAFQISDLVSSWRQLSAALMIFGRRSLSFACS